MRSIVDRVALLAARMREAGCAVGPGEVTDAVAALGLLGVGDRALFKAALRCTLVRREEGLAVFDRLFDELFAAGRPAPERRDGPWRAQGSQGRLPRVLALPDGAAESGAVRELAVDTRLAYSPHPAWRRVAWPSGDPGQAGAYRQAALLVARALLTADNPSRRFVAARRGPRVDLRRTVRGAWRAAGEPLPLRYRRRKVDPPRLAVLCDVSGSMESYGQGFLRFVHALAHVLPRRVEAFAFSTTYLRLTPYLRDRDPDRAFRRAVAAAADWGGGTRIGESLEAWCRDFSGLLGGRRLTVLIFSDGLDRGDAGRLQQAMARLRRGCRRILWINPLAADPEYRPLARGMRVALPFIDALVPVRDPSDWAALRRYLAGRPRRGGTVRHDPDQDDGGYPDRQPMKGESVAAAHVDGP